MSGLRRLSDEALVARLQHAAFSYLIDHTDEETGLVADTSRPGSPCSIAAVGFALSCYPIAVRNGWLSRTEAARRTLKVLKFFLASPQSKAADATGYRGFYYHFLDMKTGRRVWQCELSLIDTALLMAGILVAGCYFDGGGEESDIRDHADVLYRRVDWHWAQNGTSGLSQGWKPECGFLHYGWEGYNEATILYVLGLGSPTFPLTASCYDTWSLTYQWENLLGHDVLYSGPLFTHLFSHAWIDFRGIRDAFMREKNSDYFENTKNAIAIHREYGERNPYEFEGYCRDFWGVTAGDGPSVAAIRRKGRDRRFFGYMSRGVPYGPDDGTISPWAMLATLPFTPKAALSGTRHLLENYPQVCPGDRFSSGFNPTLLPASGGWLSEGWYGLDQGLLAMMIENHRSGLIWEIFRGCGYVRDGLAHAGFEGGWL
ncbi:glucoamylase family protein [Shinella zoogloeoides]|uniref:glucoamylase family protein n=1 Tax=Shinella zoogloeoides TaxID=352475 RepID=UPI0028B1AE86|nr:glucoamylase family protein [Shinella zoogloeoides]